MRCFLQPLRSTYPSLGRRLRPLFSSPNAADLALLRELLAEGRLLPIIDRRYELADVTEWIGYVKAGHARGKVVVTV